MVGSEERTGGMPAVQTLPGMEGAVGNALDEAQLRSAEARRVFEVSAHRDAPITGEEGDLPYEAVDMGEYWRLIGEGWPWRQAVYILWAALPRGQRWPQTQAELATQVLGLASDRVIRGWKAENRALDAEVAKVASGALVRHRPAIYRALIESASNPSPRAHEDRKLALEMLGDYDPQVGLTIRQGQPEPEDLSGLSDEELAALEEDLG